MGLLDAGAEAAVPGCPEGSIPGIGGGRRAPWFPPVSGWLQSLLVFLILSQGYSLGIGTVLFT